MVEYSVDWDRIIFKANRRGMNATAVIRRDGKDFCVLHDVAEQIVADVEFKSESDRIIFLIDAENSGCIKVTDLSISAKISEYARKILSDAEQDFKKRILANFKLKKKVAAQKKSQLES